MDFEWEKLINGESDIDADDINALADGIIGNKKSIKAIKDILDNSGTIPEYLTDFFKEIPEGMSIDDLKDSRYLGCYIGKETQIVHQVHYEVRYILFVDEGLYVNNDVGRDEPCHFQTKYYFDVESGKTKIKQRRCGLNKYDSYVWFDWQDVFATPQYVNEQIAKIPTGGGGEVKYFPYEPQIDITLEEAVQKMDITEFNGDLIANGNYTSMKIVLENAKLETAGGNSETQVYINGQNISSVGKIYLSMPTTFINAATKQYWGGYIQLIEGLFISNANTVGQELVRANIQMPANSSNAHKFNTFTQVTVSTVSGTMPIGTRIKIWFK